TVAKYEYDALGRRIEKNVNGVIKRYLYDGYNILAEYDDAGNMKARYTHNLAIDDPLAMQRGGSVYYYHKDALGSITALTDVNGQVAQTYEYDSFGNITNQTGNIENPFTYTGREYDAETGLYYYRARYYDARAGRFINEDPIGFWGGINLYGYVVNRPLNYIDPFGLDKCSDRLGAAGIIESLYSGASSGNIALGVISSTLTLATLDNGLLDPGWNLIFTIGGAGVALAANTAAGVV
ncbi:MAG: RHS repeat domain-containing protein, partial [Nitrospirota bacterium]